VAKKTTVFNNNLKRGVTTSCGCYQRQRAKESNLINIEGKRYGKLLVVEYVESRNGNAYWLCKCDCGNDKVISANGLKAGNSKSCGCKQGNFVHGEWSKGIASYSKYRRKNPVVKLRHNVSRAIREKIKTIVRGGTKITKNGSIFDYLPYTPIGLKNHIENLWKPWMSWNNYGGRSNDKRKTWHIDHIKPQNNFPFKSLDDALFKECWNLSNLQPLEKTANFSKGSN